MSSKTVYSRRGDCIAIDDDSELQGAQRDESGLTAPANGFKSLL